MQTTNARFLGFFVSVRTVQGFTLCGDSAKVRPVNLLATKRTLPKPAGRAAEMCVR